MTLKDALKKIEQLEQRIAMLEAKPAFEYHYHYHYPQQQYPSWQYIPYQTPTCTATVTAGFMVTQNA